MATIGNEPADDDEGLRWDGDDEPVTPAKRATPVAHDAEADTAEVAPATSSVLLVTYGIIAGAYVLYTVGWVFASLRTTSGSGDLLVQIMYQFGQFLAIAAPALWFFATLFLTRHRKPAVRVIWLVVGLVVLLPLPFILGGA